MSRVPLAASGRSAWGELGGRHLVGSAWTTWQSLRRYLRHFHRSKVEASDVTVDLDVDWSQAMTVGRTVHIPDRRFRSSSPPQRTSSCGPACVARATRSATPPTTSCASSRSLYDAVHLVTQAEDEMTRQGWNPRGIFRHYLRTQAVQELRDRLNTPSAARPSVQEATPRAITRRPDAAAQTQTGIPESTSVPTTRPSHSTCTPRLAELLIRKMSDPATYDLVLTARTGDAEGNDDNELAFNPLKAVGCLSGR